MTLSTTRPPTGRRTTSGAPGTTVTVAANVGVPGEGPHGQADNRVRFRIGDAHLSTPRHHQTGQRVQSNGKAGAHHADAPMAWAEARPSAWAHDQLDPASGSYTVMDKANPRRHALRPTGYRSTPGWAKETINWPPDWKTTFIYPRTRRRPSGPVRIPTFHGCLKPMPRRLVLRLLQPGDVVEVRDTGGAPLEIW